MKQDSRTVSRRTLFAGAGTAGALAAAASLLPAARELPAPSAQTQEPPAKGGGYHLSAHVRQYYKTTLV